MNVKTCTSVRVAILAMPETSASVVYGMYDMFMSAGRDWGLIVDGAPGVAPFVPQVVSRHGAPLVAANNVRIAPDATLDACIQADVVCVPELLVAPGEALEGRFLEEIDCLQRCYADGKILATACSGAILLAEAGLLDGYEATTHWAYCDLMTRRYPAVKVRSHRALVASGDGQRLIMAGGGTSWLDLALYLIARLAGVEIAMQTARINLVVWNDVGQQPFARLARTRQVEDAVIARCQAWIAEHYAEASPVAAMVQLSGLPERSFKRRFQQATGMSPLVYVHTLRLEEAKQMLESNQQPIEAIANEVGYEDASFFNRLFRRSVCLTPAQYRRKFGAMRHALDGRA
ncbi:helix-turn-helix domain-containing protein [Burkholderia sp. Ac-20365]|jgi:transcriptional regulator GlxA family with amidase domain|uniref:GlxA family transcriptional regulator n=1 Tax=Burkholderia sp. Ac-20365 TaxID=2703897 RepID=UPI00197B2A2E|nr:helix-turn-helix domain-containing protein [Burkholderia sp. Ac-20365]MBN3766322.1 helix-turn-helix domain-containing protein [Burkholderia sp. Ac-20365]